MRPIEDFGVNETAEYAIDAGGSLAAAGCSGPQQAAATQCAWLSAPRWKSAAWPA